MGLALHDGGNGANASSQGEALAPGDLASMREAPIGQPKPHNFHKSRHRIYNGLFKKSLFPSFSAHPKMKAIIGYKTAQFQRGATQWPR